MAWRYCAVVGCNHVVRGGLVRRGRGAAGQRLADGRTCHPCRVAEARREGYRPLTASMAPSPPLEPMPEPPSRPPANA